MTNRTMIPCRVLLCNGNDGNKLPCFSLTCSFELTSKAILSEGCSCFSGTFCKPRDKEKTEVSNCCPTSTLIKKVRF